MLSIEILRGLEKKKGSKPRGEGKKKTAPQKWGHSREEKNVKTRSSIAHRLSPQAPNKLSKGDYFNNLTQKKYREKKRGLGSLIEQSFPSPSAVSPW